MSDYICVIHHSEACAECVKEMRFLESQLRAAYKENQEQARLLGMSGSHEVALLAQLKAADKLATASEKAKNWIQPVMEGFDISKTSPAIVEVLNPLLKALSEYKKVRGR